MKESITGTALALVVLPAPVHGEARLDYEMKVQRACEAAIWAMPAVSLYDNQTRSMLQTDQRLPGIDNLGSGLKQNADGSYAIHLSPKAQTGMENNWIQTVPGKSWNTIFRLYGPLQPFYDKTWKPGDPELVK